MTRVLMLLLATTVGCFAATAVPEIDASSATSALTLIAGGMMVVRSRRNR
jgi:hypothetical protein